MSEAYTPQQLRYLANVLGVEPVGSNPYSTTRGSDLFFDHQEYEASELFRERQAFQRRFDEVFSEREEKMWAELILLRSRAESLEVEIREACKILQTDSLVVAVRALALAYRELKNQQKETKT